LYVTLIELGALVDICVYDGNGIKGMMDMIFPIGSFTEAGCDRRKLGVKECIGMSWERQ